MVEPWNRRDKDDGKEVLDGVNERVFGEEKSVGEHVVRNLFGSRVVESLDDERHDALELPVTKRTDCCDVLSCFCLIDAIKEADGRQDGDQDQRLVSLLFGVW